MSKMFIAIVSVILVAFSTAYAREDIGSEDKQQHDAEEGIRMFIPEGQFISQPIEIFVNQDIGKSANPKLKLILIPMFFSKQAGDREISPYVIAKNQTKIINHILYKGTTLLFSLRQYPFRSYEILKQVKPVLIWDNPDDPEQPYQAVGSPTNIGNDAPFLIFVLGVVGFCIIVIALWSKRAKNSVWDLLLGDDGYLSLSRTQVAAWTIVVGGIVFCFGLLMLKVPEIPKSLIALMGLSLATGGITYYAGSNEKPKDSKPKFALADLICEKDPDTNSAKTSLPKAQMLFWTVLMLYLFVVKSIVDGTLWEVPWEMVALMGMSQTAYLSVNLPGVRKKESEEVPDSDNAEGNRK